MTPLDGLVPDELARRWAVPRVVWRDQVGSTLDLGHELAAAGAPDGTVILADEQVRGRGRKGRPWWSGKGTGVWLSYIMRDQQPGALSVLSLRVGLAVAESLPLSRSEVMLKWPNDILLWEKKLGGVLCEAQWKGHNVEWVVVGIGLNVHGPVPADVGPSAVALDEVVRGTTRLGVLDALIPGLKRMGNGPELGLEERAAYARRDWLAGRRLAAPVSGVALGVDPDGSFLVQTHQGVERVVGGTVVTA